MREEFPSVRFIAFKENAGFLRLVNRGIKEAKGKYYLILNADIIIDKRSVNVLFDYLRSNPEVGLIGPKLLNFNGKLQYSCFQFYTPLIILYRRTFLGNFGFARKRIDEFLLKKQDHNKPMEVDWIMGSAMMTSRRAVKKVGLMDESFYMYFEDVDWSRRFWENGFKVVYCPYAAMFHYHGKGSASQSALRSILFNKLTREHIKSALKYFWKYLGKPNPHR